MANTLYYGDNLHVLRRYIDDESVDLIYLDPPFNSKLIFNQCFPGSQAQERIFTDYWEWDDAAEAAYREVVSASSAAPRALVALMTGFHSMLLEQDKDTLAYLSMMMVRLLELYRVLKSNGSLYFHCDPTASHYVKVCLDALFGAASFKNEIIWKCTSAHSDASVYGSVHQAILFYTKGDTYTANDEYMPYDPAYAERYYRYKDADGRRFMSDNLSAAGLSGGGYVYEWKGFTREWRLPKASMEQLDAAGLIFYTKNGFPRRKRYLDKAKGLPAQDLWTDIQALRSWHKKTGYPTEKPVPLLERILRVSSNPDDVVLDPFCGCGTTIEACQKQGRRWIGVDVAPQAVDIIRKRMNDLGVHDLSVVGWPTALDGAERLAKEDKIGFQKWAVYIVGGRMVDGREYKGGADGGVDGEMFFEDTGDTVKGIISVKGGGIGAKDIRDLRTVVEDSQAQFGVFLSMRKATTTMRDVARAGGFMTSADGTEYRKIQLLTVEDLLTGKRPELPGRNVTSKIDAAKPRSKRNGSKRKSN